MEIFITTVNLKNYDIVCRPVKLTCLYKQAYDSESDIGFDCNDYEL